MVPLLPMLIVEKSHEQFPYTTEAALTQRERSLEWDCDASPSRYILL